MKPFIFSSVIVALMVAVNVTSLSGQEQTSKCKDTANLRYLIVENAVLDKMRSRQIHVFMDPDQLDEANLRSLFGFLSKQFSKPLALNIYVETSWNRIRNPFACPQWIDHPNTKANLGPQGKWASYIRNEYQEVFRYNTDRVGETLESVVLRGAIKTK